MALARACLSNALRSRSFPLLRTGGAARLRGLAAATSFPYSSSGDTAADSSREDRSDQVAVTRAPSPARGRRGRRFSWRNPWDLSPFHLNDGLGNALLQVSENLNGLLERFSPSRLLGRLKEDDKCYKLRYEVPGLRKEDLRVTVEEGMLVITGESEDEDEDAGDESSSSTTEDEGDGGWHTRRYGYINATLLLPEDAKADEIRAELRDGILRIYIPRSEEKKSNAREIEIN